MSIGKGTHEVEIVATSLDEKPSGMQIAIKFADANGDTITGFFSTSDKAWEYTEEKLKTCGWDPVANGYRFEDLNEDPSPIAGNHVQIVCDDEMYDGKLRTKVKFVNEAGSTGGLKRMDQGAAQSAAARLRERLTGSASVPAANRKPQTEEKLPY